MTQWGLDSLFNPAKRHMDEEKRRLQSTREQLGDSSGGKRLDLESGRVTIRRGPADGEHTEEPTPPVDESPARARARARRRAGRSSGAGSETTKPPAVGGPPEAS